MPTFPLLKTGAISQYPVLTSIVHRTQVVRFLDGSEQRLREGSTVVRRWTIQAQLLDEAEARALRQFFEAQQGSFGRFSFTDPASGVLYPDCSFDRDAGIVSQRDEFDSGIELVVRSNISLP
ncbi:MAG: DUF2460 domain-containing protein [Acidobacteria bacterium]|nr:DUF2460 domain-containing protein [Acidobacteriota bacterium]